MNQFPKAFIAIVLLCFGGSFMSSASQISAMQILSPDNKLDVGNAKILASKLELVCGERLSNQAQAFQCKAICSRLGDAVEGLASLLNRKNATQQGLKTSVKTLVRRTMRCNQIWQGRTIPEEFAPFAILFKSMKNGKLPSAGVPSGISLASVDQFGAALLQLAPRAKGFQSICLSSLFKDNCIKSCDLRKNAEELAKLVQVHPVSSLEQKNKADSWVRGLHDQSATLNRKARECAVHFGRNPAAALVSLQKIGQTVLDKTNQVIKRQQAAERIALAEQKRLRQQQKYADKQAERLAYDQELAEMRACRDDSPFKGVSGCSYLTAVYDGNFPQAINIEYQSTAPYRQGWMGQSYKEMSKMFGSLYGGQGKLNQDLANMWKAHQFISGLLGTYATYYEHYYPQCIGNDAVVVTLTTERQREYRNGFNALVRTEQLPSKVDIIHIPRRLYPHVSLDKVNKDTQASVQIADMLAGAINKFPRINLYEVTMGLSSAMQRYACQSPKMQKLEQQMLKFQSHREQYNRQFY